MIRVKTPPMVEVIEREAASWQADLEQYTHSIFLTKEWILSLNQAIYTPLFIDFKLDGITIGKLSAICSRESNLKGRQLYSFASPAFKEFDPTTYNMCLASLRGFAAREKISRVILGSYDQQHSLAATAPGFHLTTRSECVVRFNNDKHLHFSKGFKKNAGKAAKTGAVFSSSKNFGLVSTLMELIYHTRDHRGRRHGNVYDPFYLRGMSVDCLEKIMQNGLGVIYTGSDADGKIHCAQLNLEQNNRSFGLLMGSDQYAYQNGYPAFVDLHIIEMARNKGFNYYNHGGNTNDRHGAGLEKYKLSMGATKVKLHGATTNFLCCPRKLLNPLMNAGRLISRANLGLLNILKEHV